MVIIKNKQHLKNIERTRANAKEKRLEVDNIDDGDNQTLKSVLFKKRYE